MGGDRPMPSVHGGLVPNRGLIDCSGQSVHGDVLRTSRLARIIHERFCCNRAFAATTSLLPGVLAAQVRPPHRLGGAHKRGALYSSRRAPLDILFQVCLRPSRLRLGVPIAGTPVAPFFMQRVEHAMGPTPGDCRVPVALPIMRARTGKDFPRDDAHEHSLPMLRTPR